MAGQFFIGGMGIGAASGGGGGGGTVTSVSGTAPIVVATGTTTPALSFAIASEAQGDIVYKNATIWTRLGAGTAGQRLTTGGAAANPSWATDANSIGVTYDGGGAAITTGDATLIYVKVPYSCTIVEANMLADQSGSIVISVWKDTYANYPPTSGDNIAASAPPTISASNKSVDTTLTGWTTTVTAGDVIAFRVTSCTTITRCTLQLKVNRT